MASITPPPPPHNLRLRSVKRPSCPPSFPRFADSTPTHRCRCAHPSSSSSSSSDNTAGGWRWDAALNDAVQSAMRRFDRLVNLPRKKKADAAARDEEVEEAGKGEEWDWERWKRHFVEVDDRERLVSLLKSQLGHAIRREDYEDAARLKVAIATAATNDTVGEVMSQLSRAIAEERYWEAAFLRDNASAGLVGWWSGISEDAHDPYGLIVRITAEHGRYVARSYNPGKLGTASTGTPLFEIFLTINKKSEYRQQAVYLRRKTFQDPQKGSSKATGAGGCLNPSGPPEEKGDIVVASTDDSGTDDEEDSSDVAELLPGLPNILQDMIPGEKLKVLKVTAPAKDDRDFLSKVIEQIMNEEEKDQDMELEDENQGENDEDSDDHGRDNQERDDADFISGPAVVYGDDKREISVEVVVGGLGQKISGSLYESLRVPAKLEKKGCKSFSFSVEKGNNQVDVDKKKSPSIGGKAKLMGQGSIENVMLDLAKVIGKDKIPPKVLRNIIELIDHSISRAQNNQQLSGTTTFHRIELSSSPDPLSGLYLGAQGLHSSEIISLQRKFGQWHDNGTKETANLEFYEYVEAVKLTGDPYVPAGQVAFRAKVGKRYQLPHKGIIPEELGVIARYKGQGRLAEPGFQNPRWVDGELVILDGKFIKGVGFVYWAPKYQYLVFFNRLRLQ